MTKDWYRIVTANRSEGFIEKKNVLAATAGNKILLKKPITLLSEADKNAVPIASLTPQQIESLAIHNGFRYIKTSGGVTGWISIGTL